jgi:hypothetical protein
MGAFRYALRKKKTRQPARNDCPNPSCEEHLARGYRSGVKDARRSFRSAGRGSEHSQYC